jgi:hypothetical protein
MLNDLQFCLRLFASFVAITSFAGFAVELEAHCSARERYARFFCQSDYQHLQGESISCSVPLEASSTSLQQYSHP